MKLFIFNHYIRAGEILLFLSLKKIIIQKASSINDDNFVFLKN